MRKFTYLLATAAMMTMAACSGEKDGYVISGTVQGAEDGDEVYLQEVSGRQLVNLDTAIIKNGKFEFKGVQDSTVYRYLSLEKEGQEALRMDFFLENGNIAVVLTPEDDSATGTASNNAYQVIRDEVSVLNKKAQEIFDSVDKSLPLAENEEKLREFTAIDGNSDSIYKKRFTNTSHNPAGVELLHTTVIDCS